MPVPAALFPAISLGYQGASMIAQGIQNKGLRRDYEKAEAGVNPIDPGQIAFMNRLRQQERAFRAGTDPSSAFAARGVQAAGQQTQQNILRAGGPGAIGQMLRAQQGVNQGMAGIGAQAAGMGNQLTGMQFGLQNMISERVYQRQRELRDQAMARFEQGRQNLNNMVSGTIATLPDMFASFTPRTTNTISNSKPNAMGTKMGLGNSQFSRTPGMYDPTMMQPRFIYPGMPTGALANMLLPDGGKPGVNSHMGGSFMPPPGWPGARMPIGL